MKLPKIMCHICNKPVDDFVYDYDISEMQVHVTVKCHDDTDKCTLSDDFIAEALRSNIEAVAFKKTAISEVRKISDKTGQ